MHEDYLATLPATTECSLPMHLVWGSYLCLFLDSANPHFDKELGVIIHGSKALGGGTDSLGEFRMKGRCARAQDENSQPRILLALTVQYAKAQPTENSPWEGLMELRLEYVDDLSRLPPEATMIDEACFLGTWHTRSADKVESGRIVLRPTPPLIRTGGFYAVEYGEQSCGLEHTGTFSQWHGTGARIRTATGQSATNGVKAGDVIKMINGKPLPPKLKSSEISKLIRNSTRPMVMHLWRDPTHSNTPQKPAKMKPLSITHSIDPNVPLTASTGMTHESSQASIQCQRMSDETQDLKSTILAEISKKREASIKLRRSRDERRTQTYVS